MMKHLARDKWIIWGILLQLCFSFPAIAGVTRCDNCNWSGYRAAAEAMGGHGYRYVIDYPQANLSLWHVMYDRELQMTIVDEIPVDASTEYSFLFLVDQKFQAKANVEVVLTPGAPPSPPFLQNPLNGLENFGAYDVINGGTFRNQLGTQLARALSGNTGNVALDNLGVTLTSVLLSLSTPLVGQTTITIRIHWTNGTKTTFIIKPSNVSQAEYQPGMSTDENGNPIPDTAIVDPATAPRYDGQWTFNTNESLERWVQSAIDRGIPVTGRGGGSMRLSCTWNGRTLACKFI